MEDVTLNEFVKNSVRYVGQNRRTGGVDDQTGHGKGQIEVRPASRIRRGRRSGDIAEDTPRALSFARIATHAVCSNLVAQADQEVQEAGQDRVSEGRPADGGRLLGRRLPGLFREADLHPHQPDYRVEPELT